MVPALNAVLLLIIALITAFIIFLQRYMGHAFDDLENDRPISPPKPKFIAKLPIFNGLLSQLLSLEKALDIQKEGIDSITRRANYSKSLKERVNIESINQIALEKLAHRLIEIDDLKEIVYAMGKGEEYLIEPRAWCFYLIKDHDFIPLEKYELTVDQDKQLHYFKAEGIFHWAIKRKRISYLLEKDRIFILSPIRFQDEIFGLKVTITRTGKEPSLWLDNALNSISQLISAKISKLQKEKKENKKQAEEEKEKAIEKAGLLTEKSLDLARNKAGLAGIILARAMSSFNEFNKPLRIIEGWLKIIKDTLKPDKIAFYTYDKGAFSLVPLEKYGQFPDIMPTIPENNVEILLNNRNNLVDPAFLGLNKLDALGKLDISNDFDKSNGQDKPNKADEFVPCLIRIGNKKMLGLLLLYGINGEKESIFAALELTAGLIAQSINSSQMLEKLRDALRERNMAYRELKEKTLMEAEFAAAEKIQKSLLPGPFPDDLKGLMASAISKPALAVGGDFYDWLRQKDRLDIIIADISGKGLGAAIIMSMAKKVWRMSINAHDSLEKTADILNMALEEEGAGKFMTALLLRYEDNILKVINAGHLPLIYIKKTKETCLFHSTSPPLGITDIKPKTENIVIQEGDIAFACTDGLTEARNKKDEEYGIERLARFLVGQTGFKTDEILENMENEIENFAGQSGIFDDLTLLALKGRK